MGHDAGGVLGNEILYNGGCYELDDNGNIKGCRLCDRDKRNIEQVQSDMYEVIDRGIDNDFIGKLEELIQSIKRS